MPWEKKKNSWNSSKGTYQLKVLLHPQLHTSYIYFKNICQLLDTFLFAGNWKYCCLLLLQKVDKYENSNKLLENKIQNFEEEINELKDLLNGHKCTRHVQHMNTETSSLRVVERQEVQKPQPKGFTESCFDNDESQKLPIEQFLDEFHDLWDNL